MESIRTKMRELPDGWGERKKRDNILEKNREIATKRNEKVGEGLNVGKIVSFQVADGYAYYEISKVGDKVSEVNWIPELCPDKYHAKEVDKEGNILTSRLEKAVKRMDGEFSSL
jgi:hypothetical protein